MRTGILCSLAIVLGVSTSVAQHSREVRLPLENGRLSVLALTRALLNEYGYSGDHLHFRDVKVDVKGVKGTMMLEGMSKALGGTARFRKVDDDRALSIEIDQTRARVMRRRVKDRFGRWVSVIVGQDIMARQYALDVPNDLRADETFVLCVHGVDSSAKTFDDLRRFLARGEEPIRSGTFTYANDEAIDRIAEELAKRLRTRARNSPEQRIILVAHSMGGLVARYMVETKALDPGNVTTLVMIGVPNHGSRLSRLRSGIDLLEFFRDQGDKPRVLAPLFDGMGEAGWDLWPESPFLATLNANPRNPRVRYYLILGDKAVMTADRLATWRSQIMKKVRRMENSEVYEKKIETWLSDLDEVVHGAGDGAVSVERGRLEGVREVVMPLTHNGLLNAAPRGSKQPAFEQVRAWVIAARRAN